MRTAVAASISFASTSPPSCPIPRLFRSVYKKLNARGKSSAASAANAAINHVQSLVTPTPAGDWFSGALRADDNPYGVPEGLIFSYPLRSAGDGTVEIVQGLELSDYAKEKIKISAEELLAEREAVADLLK